FSKHLLLLVPPGPPEPRRGRAPPQPEAGTDPARRDGGARARPARATARAARGAARESRPLALAVPLALAALGALPSALWNALGARRGTGAGTYLALHASFGAPAPLYLAMLPKEIFSGWWGRGALRLALFGALVGVPLVAGALRGLRGAPRETVAMIA